MTVFRCNICGIDKPEDELENGVCLDCLASINTKGLCCKSFRKTWESWLVSYYPDKLPYIFLSHGHNELTSLKHYLNLPFTKEDKQSISEYVRRIEW